MFAEADKSFNEGSYSKAGSKSQAVAKTIQKKYNNQASLRAFLNLYQARTYEYKANYPAMEKEIVAAMPLLESSKEADFANYMVGICKIADNYIHIGYWRKAQEILEKLQEEVKARGTTDEFLKAELTHRLLTTYVYAEQFDKLENFGEQLQKWNELQNAVTGYAGKLSPNDIKYRKEQLARLYILRGEMYRLKGDYSRADSAYKYHQNTINKLVSSGEVAGKFELAKGMMELDSEDYAEAESVLESAKKKVGKNSRTFIEICIQLARAYTARDKDVAAKGEIKAIENIATAYTPDENIYLLTDELLSAEKHISNDRTDDAKKILEELLKNPEDIMPAYHPLRIAVWDNLHYTYLFGKKPDYIQAENSLKSTLAITKEIYGEKSLPYLYYNVLLADHYLTHTDDFDKARDLMASEPYKPLLTERSEYHKNYDDLSQAMSNYFDVVDRYKEALALIQKTVNKQLKKYGKESIEYGLELPKLAEFQVKVGQYREAEQSMKLALRIIRKEISKKSPEYAEALAQMAKIYGIIGLYDEAKDLLITSSKIYNKLDVEDVTEKAKSVEEMAFLYILIGEYAQTEDILNEILVKKEQKFGKNNRLLINPLNQLGALYLIKGDYGQAEKLISQSADIAKRVYGPKTLKTAESLSMLAKYYIAIGDYDRAKDYLSQVIEIQEKQLGTNHIELGKSYKDMAMVRFHQSSKNAPESFDLIAKAKKIMASTFDNKHPMYAEVLKTEGEILVENKRYGEAFTALNEANGIWLEKLERRNLNSAYVYSLMGDIYAKLKKFEEARDNYSKAELIYRKVLSIEHPDYVKNQSKLGRMYFVKGDLKRANELLESTTAAYLKFIKIYFPALSEREKARYWNKIKTDFEFYNTLAIRQKDNRPELIEKMYDFRLATKAILLNSSIKVRQSILNGKDEELKAKFKEWISKKEELTALLSLGEEQTTESTTSPDQLIEDINRLEKEMSEKSDLFANALDKDLFTWQDVRKTLKDNEAAVEVIRYRHYEDGFTDQVRYAVLIVTPKTRKNPTLVVLENGKELEGKFLKNYRNRIKFQSKDHLSYTQFWKPIEAEMENAKVVYFSPDGVYNSINPESILIEEDTYVIDKMNVRSVSNTKDLVVTAQAKEKKTKKTKTVSTDKKDKTVVLFGNPTFYTSVTAENMARNESETTEDGKKVMYVSQLPGTELEIEAIRLTAINRGYKVEIYKEQSAIESRIKDMKSPMILHIATHGFFDEPEIDTDIELETAQVLQQDPLRRSGVLGAGAGDLLAKAPKNYDMEDGILTAYEVMNAYLDGTSLVTLSACETGLGEVQEGEGVYGLQRAFLVAGAEALIMSLFKVNDEITQKLMDKFYTKYFATLDKRKAFNEAQKEIKAEYPMPIYWGAFNMIGVE
jgi:CHAT domain-containing protein